MAAVPRRAGRPPARPCWSSRTCTGPTSRCCASSSCSARPSATCRCCCSCTARPELIDRDPSWAGAITGSLTITLPPLRDTGIATLYAHMFGQAAFSADMLSPLVELADGNPLYAHEYVRMLIEQGALRQSGRGWSLEQAPSLPMPDSVHAVIANRVDLLDAERPRGAAGRRRGRHAVLAGRGRRRAGPHGRVGRAVAAPAGAARPGARAGRRPRWPASRSTGSGHVLVRDVCYQRLPRTERVARHERTADWLDALSPQPRHRPRRGARPPPLGRARDRPHARRRRRPRTRPAARDALHRAARRAYALHALDAAASHAGRALGAGRRSRDPVDRLQLELLAHRDRVLPRRRPRSSPAAAPTSWPRSPTGCYAGRRRGVRRPGLDAARPGRLAARRPAATRCPAWTARSSCSTSCPTPRRRPTRTPSWAGCTCSTTSDDPAIAAAGAAAEIAERLGLVETRDQRPDHRRHRPLPGRRPGRPGRAAGGRPSSAARSGCSRCPGPCRTSRTRCARRATGSAPTSCSPRRAGRPSRADTPWPPATPARRCGAYFDGDFDRLLGRRGRVRRHARPASGTCRSAACAPACGCCATSRCRRRRRRRRDRRAGDRAAAAASTGCAGRRWAWPRCAGRCRAAPTRPAALLDELAESLVGGAGAGQRRVDRRGRVRRGPDRAGRGGAGPRDAGRVGHRTPWAEAALRTVTAALAAADGDHRRAAELHLAAADIYGRIPDVTDRMLALALAAAELTRAGDRRAHGRSARRGARVRVAQRRPRPARPGRPADQPDRAGGGAAEPRTDRAAPTITVDEARGRGAASTAGSSSVRARRVETPPPTITEIALVAQERTKEPCRDLRQQP